MTVRRPILLALVITFAALASVPSVRADAASRYLEASAIYEDGRFDEADAAFRALLAEFGPHPDALLGLGNAAYRRGDRIGAVYAYEWGLRLRPADEALRENLRIARTQLVADVFPSAESESAVKAQAALARVSGRSTLLAALVLWTLGFLVLAARLRGRLEGWSWLGVALILLSLPAFAHAAWQRQRIAGRTEGILQAPEVDVRSGPGPAYQELYVLHAGTLVQVLEERTGWRRVRLPNGSEGWVEAQDLAVFGDLATLSPKS